MVEVEGATDDQLTTLYSNLYRLNLYPNSAFENTGTAARPATSTRCSRLGRVAGRHTPTQTGATVVDGKVYVNNGFWDTYRTIWPAYSLLYPDDAGELVDGFVQQYRDGGWIARWSSPGYANLMTGTSSDVAFADAYVKGVKGFDAERRVRRGAEERDRRAARRPERPNVGRKGLRHVALPRLHADATSARACRGRSRATSTTSASRNMATALADDPSATRPSAALPGGVRVLPQPRAATTCNMFDPAVGFFQGRDADGDWQVDPAEYDPRVWGHERLHRDRRLELRVPRAAGRAAASPTSTAAATALAKKLDTFFATPETRDVPRLATAASSTR